MEAEGTRSSLSPKALPLPQKVVRGKASSGHFSSLGL